MSEYIKPYLESELRRCEIEPEEVSRVEQIVFVHEGLPPDICYGSPIPNPDNKLPNEALRDYLNSLDKEALKEYLQYQLKLARYYDGPGGP